MSLYQEIDRRKRKATSAWSFGELGEVFEGKLIVVVDHVVVLGRRAANQHDPMSSDQFLDIRPLFPSVACFQVH